MRFNDVPSHQLFISRLNGVLGNAELMGQHPHRRKPRFRRQPTIRMILRNGVRDGFGGERSVNADVDPDVGARHRETIAVRWVGWKGQSWVLGWDRGFFRRASMHNVLRCFLQIEHAILHLLPVRKYRLYRL